MTSPEDTGSAAVGYSLAAASIALAALGQVLMKAGVGSSGDTGLAETLMDAGTHPLVLIGLAAYILSSGLWLLVLSRMDLASVYPLGAASYVLVVFSSRLLGETVTVYRWLGVVLIVIGIMFVSGIAGRPRSVS